MQEYEQLKREMEAKKLAAKNNLLGSSPTAPTPEVAPAKTKVQSRNVKNVENDFYITIYLQTRTDIIHERIGFDPKPKPSQ